MPPIRTAAMRIRASAAWLLEVVARRRRRRQDQAKRRRGPGLRPLAVGERAGDRHHQVIVVDVGRAVGVPLAVQRPTGVALAVLFLVGSEFVTPVVERGAGPRAAGRDPKEAARVGIEDFTEEALRVEDGDVSSLEL